LNTGRKTRKTNRLLHQNFLRKFLPPTKKLKAEAEMEDPSKLSPDMLTQGVLNMVALGAGRHFSIQQGSPLA
jgi:hypothetical protein